MADIYHQLILGASPADLGPVDDAVTRSGAHVVGAWAGVGSIGFSSDEIVVLVRAADEQPAETGYEVREATMLAVGAHPRPIGVIDPGGVYAHRSFELAEHDWDEFLSLSLDAWPAFESAYDARVLAMFRDTTVDDPPGARALLITRYASLAEWERSRRPARTGEGDDGERFRRRHALTRRTAVRIAWPLAR